MQVALDVFIMRVIGGNCGIWVRVLRYRGAGACLLPFAFCRLGIFLGYVAGKFQRLGALLFFCPYQPNPGEITICSPMLRFEIGKTRRTVGMNAAIKIFVKMAGSL